MLDDMRSRIRATRWADDFGNSDWRYGVERGWLQSICAYWADGFDWRAQEAAMNRFPHFRVEIDGIPIHFMHIRGKGPNPMPLIMTHGWPWTFWDWQGVIGPLTDPARFGGDPSLSFDLVIPSLPGFGFSTPLRTNGVESKRIAALWAILMHEVLGYDRFSAVGGDIGAAVTGELALAHPELLFGILLTLPALPGVSPLALPDDAWAEDEAWMRARMVETLPTFTHIGVHAHVPQTLAYALCDSPVGTAAWIWERRREWSDCDGDLEGYFGRDALCTLASTYWLTNTIGTSIRWYHAWAQAGAGVPVGDRRVKVPTGIAIFRKDVLMMPRSAAQAQCDLHRWSILPEGGHFAPAERPDHVIAEVRALFAKLR
jgi:pimeloyl-ACP methyl ester carboxylesterase